MNTTHWKYKRKYQTQYSDGQNKEALDQNGTHECKIFSNGDVTHGQIVLTQSLQGIRKINGWT